MTSTNGTGNRGWPPEGHASRLPTTPQALLGVVGLPVACGFMDNRDASWWGCSRRPKKQRSFRFRAYPYRKIVLTMGAPLPFGLECCRGFSSSWSPTMGTVYALGETAFVRINNVFFPMLLHEEPESLQILHAVAVVSLSVTSRFFHGGPAAIASPTPCWYEPQSGLRAPEERHRGRP